MADYVLSAKGTYDGKDFDSGVGASSSKLESFMGKAQSLGSKITSTVGGVVKNAGKAVVGTVVAAGAAVTTLAATGGVARALNIEQAQYKLKQMGMDVDSIMASCNEAVSGTKFGLDAAATSASLLGTSGVQAGEQMTQTLKAAAGVATIAGTGMEDVSSIFSKIAAKGKVTGDELLQLNERGVNATDALAKHLGKTSAEVQKMVSSGQVDFQTFSDAMYACFGDAASGANDTFQGAMSNVRAALSRVGAKFASPALDALRKVFVATMPAINAVSSALDPLVASFSRVAGVVSDRLTKGLEEFTYALTETDSFVLAFSMGLRSAFEGTGVGEFFSSVDDAIGVFFETVRDGGSKLEGLRNALGYFSENSPALAGINALHRGFRAFRNALADGSSVVEAFGKAFSLDVFDGARSAIDGLKGKIESLPQPFQTVISAISKFGGFVSSVLGSVGVESVAFAALFVAAFLKLRAPVTAAMGLMSGISSSVGAAISLMGSKVGSLGAGFQLLGGCLTGGLKGLAQLPGLLSMVASPIGLVVAAVAALAAGFAYLMVTNEDFRSTVMSLVAQIGAELAPILLLVGQTISDLASSVLPLISNMISTLIPVIGQIAIVILQIIAAIAPLVTMLVSALLPIITLIIQTVMEVMAQIVALVVPVIQAILTAIQAALPVIQAVFVAAMAAILAVVQTVWPIVQTVIETVMGVIQGVIAAVTAAINGDWDAVWTAVAGIADTVWNGIQSVVTTVMDILGSVISTVLGVIQGIWNSVWGGIQAFASSVWSAIQSAVSSAINAVSSVISSVLGTIKGVWDGAWNSVKSVLDGAWDAITNGVSNGINGVLDFMGGLPGRILGALGDLGGLLWDAGSQIMSGLLSGITSGVQGVFDFVSGIGSTIASLKGPKRYDLKLLVPNGGWIMESLSTGLELGEKGLVKTIASITDDIADANFGTAKVSYETAAANATAADYVGNTYSFGNIYVEAHDFEDAKTVDDVIDIIVRASRVNQ